MDVDEVDVIEWKFPPELKDALLLRAGIATLVVVSFGILVSLTTMDAPGARLFQCAFLLMVVVTILMWRKTSRQCELAQTARYFADDLGFHGEPIFNFTWRELISVRTTFGPDSATTFLRVQARNPLKTQKIAIDPASVDVDKLLEFANRKIAEAAPPT